MLLSKGDIIRMIRPSNQSCYLFFKECTKDFGSYHVAESFGNMITHKKFFHDIDAIAGFLDKSSICRGDVVTVFLPNNPQSYAAFYAISKIGAIANIVHPLTPANVLDEILESTKSKAIFILDILAEPYKQVLESRDLLTVICSNSDYAPPLTRPAIKLYEKTKSNIKLNIRRMIAYHTVIHLNFIVKAVENNGAEDAVYLHGGGTTGKSKTIRISSNNLNALAFKLSLLDSPHYPGEEYSLIVLPLFHAFGLGVAMHFSMCAGFTCISMPKFSADKAIKYIKKYNVTFILGVPNMFKKMYDCSDFDGPHLKKLRLLWAGGDMVSETFLNTFNSKLQKWGSKGKLLRGYGLTEVTSVCTANIASAYKENSIGRPLAEIDIRIWDDKHKKLPPNTIGEIVVGGDTVMNGYFNSEDSGVYTDRKGRRWVLSGDLGYLDEDGYLFFTGRKKRMIIISGYNVYPNDIESRVLQLDYINEACAVQGYVDAKPVIKLFVSLNEPTTNPDEICRSIKEYCDKTLERFSRPSFVTIMDKLPRTGMGKIDFMKLTDTPPAPQPTKKELREERRAQKEFEKAEKNLKEEAEQQKQAESAENDSEE